MPPPEEFQTERATLEDSDLDRVFAIPEFGRHTTGGSCRIRDIEKSALSDPRVQQFMEPPIDLRIAPKLELLIFAADPETWPLVVVDGNHRLIAHYWNHRSIEGVPVFICSHPKVATWGFCPPTARQRSR